MGRVWSIFALAVLVISSCVLLGCGGNPQGQLISITITPSSGQVEGQGAGGHVQYTAYGTFDRPRETRDITAEVKWTTDAQNVGFFDGARPGLITSGVCGLTNVKVTASSNLIGGATTNQAVMTAFATFKVTDATNSDPLCTQ